MYTYCDKKNWNVNMSAEARNQIAQWTHCNVNNINTAKVPFQNLVTARLQLNQVPDRFIKA